jgi:glycosyltransferase involved in cell wall biosynthesis
MNIAASFEDTYGYGYFTCEVVKHLVSRGVPVRLTPLFGHRVPSYLTAYVNPLPAGAMHDLMFTAVANNPSDINAKALFTMYETTKIPVEYGSQLKRFKHIIVPSKFSADSVRPWNKHVRICPLGAAGNWTPIVFTPFVFSVVAADHNVPERKRVQDVVDAFSAEFKTEADVQLQLKRSDHCAPINTFDVRVLITKGFIERNAYANFMNRTTVGIQMSAAEGWSLPTNEFMAIGRPVICPIAGAMADYVSPRYCFPLDFTMKRAPQKVFMGCGNVPYATVESLRRQMRFAYENRFEVARRGILAREASLQFTPHTMGQRFYDLCQNLF